MATKKTERMYMTNASLQDLLGYLAQWVSRNDNLVVTNIFVCQRENEDWVATIYWEA